MWRCVGLLLFLGQCIIVCSESSDTPSTRNTRNTECCPCPEGRNADLTASATTHFNDDCPCKARSADSDPAASIFTPIFRTARPPARQTQQNDMKPLLEPEVGLASSVLETLREATEEEYQEALARDAARNALQDDINKHVKIVVNHDPREADAEPEASNSHSVRCADPLENNFLARSSLDYPSIGQTPIPDRFLIYKRPLQNKFKTPVPEQDLFVLPTDNLNKFIQGSDDLPVTSLLHARNNLQKQLDLRHMFNLDKLASLLPNEILSGRNIIIPGRINNLPGYNPEYLLDVASAETENIKHCVTEDKSNNSEGTVTTKILNILPTQNNHEIQPKTSEDSDFHEENIFNEGDGTVEESRDNFKTAFSPDINGYKSLPSSLDGEDLDPQFKTEHLTSLDEDIPSIKGSIIKTFEDFKEANAAIHENLKSSLDNVLKLNSARTESNGDYITRAVPVTLDAQARKNKLEESPRLKYADQDALLKSSDALVSNKLDNQNQQITNLHSNRETDQRNAESQTKTDIMEKDSENIDTCLVYGRSQSKNANSDLSEMKMAASEPFNRRYGFSQNSLENRPQKSIYLRDPIKNVEDINLDIFDFQPFSLDQDNTKNAINSLPRLNMKSYKTRVPILQSLDLKPVKLQKAFRKGNDVLGAVLTIQPHFEGKSNNMVSSQSRSSDNIFNHPLGMLPNFNDLRSFLENSAKHILKLPHLSRNVGNLDSPLINIEDAADNLRTYTEDTLKNVQQSLGNTLHNVRDRDRTILGDALLNPNGLVESLSKNNLDVNEKLQDLQINLNDRLQRIFDQSRSSSNIQPSNSRYNLYPKNIPSQRKQTNTDQKLLSNRINQNRPLSKISSNRESTILHRKLNPKVSIQSQRVFENTNLPVRKVDKPITLQNARFSKTVESNRNLQRVFQPKEYKSVPSLTSKKASILESLTNKKPLLPILEKKLSRNSQPDRNFLTRNTLTREQKTSPSESVYKTVPEETARDSVHAKNIDDKKFRAALPPSILKKSFLPNIAENNFLSKVKEAVTKDSLANSNIGDRNDVIPSPSEIVKSAEPPRENIAFNCKMVCDKA
ncbi:uncharacterized protein LOC110999398 [Pieris rapae]|uniref:uncharacterized protein LOC110999398 n=1 Tax=Pieris rapae TaxID=64459 RepID=UPI001E27AD76|nr:uncharacterized protein LOC110999398 [Pieris rapae]